jgi:plasmid stability protein
MATMIQIRNVPDDVHRRAKARAALEGLTLSELALRELKRALERPRREEVLARLAALPPLELDPSPADAVREERAAR